MSNNTEEPCKTWVNKTVLQSQNTNYCIYEEKEHFLCKNPVCGAMQRLYKTTDNSPVCKGRMFFYPGDFIMCK